MRDDILLKIANLCSPDDYPLSECEVLYFMVEIRKVLDSLTSKNELSTLYFYCNWVAHISMDRGNIIVGYLEKLTEQFNQAQPFIMNPELYGLISFDALRKQVIIFLQNNNLNNWAGDNTKWSKFKILLLNILVDCPLEDRSGNLLISKFEYKLGENGNIDYAVYDRESRKFSGTLQ
jgi:hypothetical protein